MVCAWRNPGGLLGGGRLELHQEGQGRSGQEVRDQVAASFIFKTFHQEEAPLARFLLLKSTGNIVTDCPGWEWTTVQICIYKQGT